MSPESPSGDGGDANPNCGDDSGHHERDAPLLTLPDSARDSLKTPIGPIETDADRLLESVSGPVIAVGDVVTHHLLEADYTPAVAFVDGYTERTAVDAVIKQRVTADVTWTVCNPPATITEALVSRLRDGLEREGPATILVDGEEDLAALPAILAAPEGASVIYGQPGQGMVHVLVDDDVRAEIRDLLTQFEGDHERLFELCSSKS